jgi:hypothetical protein
MSRKRRDNLFDEVGMAGVDEPVERFTVPIEADGDSGPKYLTEMLKRS